MRQKKEEAEEAMRQKKEEAEEARKAKDDEKRQKKEEEEEAKQQREEEKRIKKEEKEAAKKEAKEAKEEERRAAKEEKQLLEEEKRAEKERLKEEKKQLKEEEKLENKKEIEKERLKEEEENRRREQKENDLGEAEATPQAEVGEVAEANPQVEVGAEPSYSSGDSGSGSSYEPPAAPSSSSGVEFSMDDFDQFLGNIQEDTRTLDIKLSDFITTRGGSYESNYIIDQKTILKSIEEWKNIEGDVTKFFYNIYGGASPQMSKDEIMNIIKSIPFDQVLGKRLGDALDAIHGALELKGAISSIKNQFIDQIPTGIAKLLSDAILSRLIDFVKGFNVNSNILVPIFLGLEFLRKSYVLNVVLLGAQQTVLSQINSMGPKFYDQFLILFSKTKIKNFDGKPLVKSFPSSFKDWKTLEEIWKVIKYNLSTELGSDLIKYINDPNNKKHFTNADEDIKDIEIGMKISEKVKSMLSTQQGGSEKLDTDDIDNLFSNTSSEYEKSTISPVLTEDLQERGFLGLFLKPLVNTEDVSTVSTVNTSDISTIDSVLTIDLPKKGFFDFFKKKKHIEVSPVTPVNTSSLSKYFSPNTPDNYEFTTTESSIIYSDTEFLKNRYPEIFEKYNKLENLKNDESFDSDIWISTSS